MGFPYDNLGVLDEGVSVPHLHSHLHSPNSVPVKYQNERGDFFCTPTDDAGDGWGKPFLDPDGKPLPYGTLGGEDITKTIFQREGEWKAHHRGGYQVFGEIDWRGKEVDGVRPILSYHGTSGRHIHDGFIYGTDPKHNYIYYRGKILAVAPKAVMGASLYQDVNGKYWLIAIIDQGNGEVVYRKVHSTVTKTYAEDNYSELSSRAANNSVGWKSAGTLDFGVLGTMLKPTTPFFASESGLDFAQCRNTLMSFFNGKEDTTEVATAILRAKLIPTLLEGELTLAIGAQTASGEQDRFNYLVQATKSKDPNIYSTPAYSVSVSGTAGSPAKLTVSQLTSLVYNACQPWSLEEHSDFGNFSDYTIGSPVHYWSCSDIVAVASVGGTTPFAVDYIGNTMIEVRVVAEQHRYFVSQWAIGVDGAVKTSGYNVQKYIDAPDIAGGNDYSIGVGINNSTPTTVCVTGGTAGGLFGTIAPDFSTIPYDLWYNSVSGKSSNGGYASLNGSSVDNWTVQELAYNSGNYAVKGGGHNADYFSQGDGTTKSGMAYKVDHRLEYRAEAKDRKVRLSEQALASVSDYDSVDFGESANGLMEGFMRRNTFLHFLDIRQGDPFYVATVDEIDVTDISEYKVALNVSAECQGEKRKRIEISIPNRDAIKVFVKDAEPFSHSGNVLLEGWTYYPCDRQQEPMAATVWGGDPVGGTLPPMSLTESLHSENQEKTYGTLFAPRFGVNDDMYYNTLTAFVHHTAAYPALTGEAYIGWANASGSLVNTPTALQQPLQETTFSWTERYQSYTLHYPKQDEDNPNLPRIDSFIVDSVVLDSPNIELKFTLGGYETHQENIKSDVIVSATTNGTEYLVALQYSTENKPTCYYSYFTGSDSSLTQLTKVGENFIPVGVR